MADSTLHVGPPISTVFFLAADVEKRVTTEEEAVGEIRASGGYAISEADVQIACRVVHDEDTRGADCFMFAKLVLVAAEAAHGRSRDSPWWLAADMFVYCTMRSLHRMPAGERLAAARAVVDEQISLLRADRGLLGRPRERDELADTLMAAALLLYEPYYANLDGPDHLVSLERWRFRRAQIGMGRPEDGDQPLMPAPMDAAKDALDYLDQAVRIARGHLRGLCLVSQLYVLEVLTVIDPGAGEVLRGRRRELAAEAFPLLDRERAPVEYLDVLAELVRAGRLPATLPADRVLPAEPGELAARYGPVLALSLICRTMDLTKAGTPPAGLWAAGEALAGQLGWPDARQFWTVAVHSLPGDRMVCQPGTVAVKAVRAQLEQVHAAGEMTTRQLAATLVHVAAHVANGQERAAIDVLDRIEILDQDFAADHASPLNYLVVTLAFRGGAALRAAGEREQATLLYLLASHAATSLGVSVLCAELAEQGLACVEELEPDEADALFTIGAALSVANTALFPLGAGAYESQAEFVRQVGQRFDQVLVRPPLQSQLLMLHHHYLFKGADFGLLVGQPGPRQWDGYTENLLAEVDHAQAAEPYRPEAADQFPIARPSGMQVLCYASADEAQPGSTRYGRVANLRRSVDANLTRTMMEQASAHGTIVRHDPGLGIGDARQLQAVLPPDTVLISHYLGVHGDEPTDAENVRARLTTVLVTAEDYEVTATNLRADGGILRLIAPGGGQTFTVHGLGWLIAELREAVNADPLHREVTAHAARQLADCYYKLGGPLPQYLGKWRAAGKTHLCFWPHGPLHLAPIHLLHTEGRPLAEDWTVSTVPSLTVLTRPPLPPHPSPTLLAAGLNDGGKAFGLPAQPEVERHVREVAAGFGSGTVLVGAEATPRRVLAAAPRARYLYIATHGSHDTEAAWFQCLYLHPDPDNDGRLFAHDILRADLRGVDLVGLSACETALGRFDRNDNVRGLPAALLLAGVSTVVGTFWPVAPEVATRFFSCLFAELAAGRTKREAFRHAQLVARQEFPAYRDWGAFVLIGDWR
ncbi:CHAT domain-containing protein [Kutzneria albida]|uniref:CHAT domain-containing protein n=1 Tax=Kutzneria albida DSM 43870 TaxID=1449976 RepID=W5W8V9_9PSEU|nr:CHAT domain-containing protein [Kutzneria albida]AHH97150.1 hypothetical protein KALB_3786 [Kutzneria albida DSM 43870]